MARSAAHAARLPRSRRRRRPSASRGRTRSARRAGSRRVWLRRVIAIGALVCALGAGYMLWLRDSSLVAVREVSVVGIDSAERDEVRAALEQAARGMTTLHVREDELRGAATAELDLPKLEAQAEPSATRLVDDALEQARVLGAAPDPMRPLVEQTNEDDQGVGVVLTDGITLLFGDAGQADAKWAAAARVLADGELGGLSYIDLRAPERPAVGGAAPAAGAA